MRPIDAERLLRDAVARRGVTLVERDYEFRGRGEDAHAVWEAFVEVSALPLYDSWVDDAGEAYHLARSDDTLLFEGAPWDDEGFFLIEIRRQFSFSDEEGKYLQMMGVFLEIYCPLTPQLRSLKQASIAGWGGPLSPPDSRDRPAAPDTPFRDSGQWASEAEQSQLFNIALRDATPERFAVFLSDY